MPTDRLADALADLARDRVLPTDHFSTELRKLHDNPGALHARSTIEHADFYGNTETWIVDTFRIDSDETAFVQRSSATAPLRLVLPPVVTKALTRQRDQLSHAGRRRAGHKLVAIRKQRGDVLGNPAALKAARRKQAKARA